MLQKGPTNLSPSRNDAKRLVTLHMHEKRNQNSFYNRFD
jgi:hypothetical protein